MSENFPGKGRRKPQINLPIEKIHLDIENPRLAKQQSNTTEFDLIKTLYEEYDLEELAMSMAENGYFDEEPIIVVPKKLPKGLNFESDPDALTEQLMKLVKEDKIEFIAVEGNRRTATAKILTDHKLRERLKIRSDSFPKPKNDAVTEDLSTLPAIVYAERKQVAPYLGVRHITGLLKWDAYAKAAYIAQNIEEEVKSGNTIDESIKTIQQQIADRSDVIRKQYLCYKVMRQAEDDLEFDTKRIKNKFSLITVALNSPAIREYMSCPTYREVDFSNNPIPTEKIKQLDHVLTWIYGDGKKEPILSDSRRITSELAPVLRSKDATEHLIQYGNLEEAYERSEGEKGYIVKKIISASSAIRYSLGYAYKYKGVTDIVEAVTECKKLINELAKMITDDRSDHNA